MMKIALATIAAALALSGCGSMQKKEPPPKPFTGTHWQVMLELPLHGEQPYVRFGDGRMEGFGGCNRFVARYVQDTVGARAIAIGRIDMNRHLCADESAQMAESHILEVLAAVSSYQVTGDQLVMTGSGGTLRFFAKPEGSN